MSGQVARYHPLIVALHWLAALLILANLVIGRFVLHELPNTAEKLPLLRGHMTVGIIVFVLMLIRLPSRIFTAKPPIPHRNRALKWLALANHWLLYLVVLSMVSTGFGIAAFANLWPLLRGESVPLPKTFEQVEPFVGHEFFASALIALVLLHLAGVVYHWIGHRENITGRMWFGSRKTEQHP